MLQISINIPDDESMLSELTMLINGRVPQSVTVDKAVMQVLVLEVPTYSLS